MVVGVGRVEHELDSDVLLLGRHCFERPATAVQPRVKKQLVNIEMR